MSRIYDAGNAPLCELSPHNAGSIRESQHDLAAFYETIRRKYLMSYFSYVSLAMGVNVTIDGFATASVINPAILVLIGSAWLWRDSRLQGMAVAGVVALFRGASPSD
jgi:hypothetical protein